MALPHGLENFQKKLVGVNKCAYTFEKNHPAK
jgi:hypothetical protein